MHGLAPMPTAPTAPPKNGIVWEEPPPRGRRSSIANEIAAPVPQLRENPGKWARLYTWTGKSSAGGMRKALAARADLVDIEWSANVVGKGSALYGRCKRNER